MRYEGDWLSSWTPFIKYVIVTISADLRRCNDGRCVRSQIIKEDNHSLNKTSPNTTAASSSSSDALLSKAGDVSSMQTVASSTPSAAVFVHCQSGMSRSATVVLAYLMRHRKMGFGDAYAFLKARRSIVAPNEGFMNMLRDLDRSPEFRATDAAPSSAAE